MVWVVYVMLGNEQTKEEIPIKKKTTETETKIQTG